MSGVSLPVTRPVGRALVVGAAATRAQPIATLKTLGYQCDEADDPYAAASEICCKRNGYDALILALASLYREELALVATVKRHVPKIEIWLSHTDGRQAALAEAMRLGADGLLADDGLHRIALTPPQPPGTTAPPTHDDDTAADPANSAAPEIAESSDSDSHAVAPRTTPAWPDDQARDEPVLTAEELRALLLDEPTMPPSGSAQ
jgi:hypothetical protein